MSCSVDSLESAARRFEALAASCSDEASSLLYWARARRCRELLDELDSSGYPVGCGD